jgi:UDP-3-O-[3-hydroxymyristoyl] N-acetylglucosamine deacetylase
MINRWCSIVIYRQTLAAPAVCAGLALHSGDRVRLVMQPATAGSGIVFVRSDITDRDNRIEARADMVTGVRLGTTISNDEGVSVSTVEHLMAALAGMGIDDLQIDINGSELPAMDGSSGPFVDLIQQVGLRSHAVPRRAIQVLKPITVQSNGRSSSFLPALRPAVDIEIVFDHAAVGRQTCAFDVAPHIFADDIAAARTFGFRKDYEALLEAGLARGGSMDNAIVLNDNGIENPEGLRFENEFARHKALDALGDIYLAGAPIIGRYIAHCPGHEINNAAVRALLDDTSAWKMVSMRDKDVSGMKMALS